MNRFTNKNKRLGSTQGGRRYDLPLNNSAGTGFLILLIALMTFLAVMALAASFAMGDITQRWSSGLENKVTLEIPAEQSNGNLRTPADIHDLKNKTGVRLKQLPYVESFEIMAEQDIQDLISPWLGKEMILQDLPLPGLVSVNLHVSDPVVMEKLQNEMHAIDPDIKVDTHEAWLGDLLRLTGALQFAAAMVALIIGFTTVTAVSGAIKTRMAIHHEEVELLHLMGASDEYITRQLQRHALIMAFKGSLAGGGIALVTLITISLISGDTAAALLPDFNIRLVHVLGILAIPGMACLIAAVTARFTVLRVLALMP